MGFRGSAPLELRRAKDQAKELPWVLISVRVVDRRAGTRQVWVPDSRWKSDLRLEPRLVARGAQAFDSSPAFAAAQRGARAGYCHASLGAALRYAEAERQGDARH